MSTIAFEAQEMTVQRHQELAALDGSPELVPLGGVIEELRMVKDESEIELLARACAITGEAFSAALDWLRPGVTERAFAVALERAMIDLGAEAPAFDSIVASGPNGAIPHHVPGQRDEPGAGGDQGNLAYGDQVTHRQFPGQFERVAWHGWLGDPRRARRGAVRCHRGGSALASQRRSVWLQRLIRRPRFEPLLSFVRDNRHQMLTSSDSTPFGSRSMFASFCTTGGRR